MQLYLRDKYKEIILNVSQVQIIPFRPIGECKPGNDSTGPLLIPFRIVYQKSLKSRVHIDGKLL